MCVISHEKCMKSLFGIVLINTSSVTLTYLSNVDSPRMVLTFSYHSGSTVSSSMKATLSPWTFQSYLWVQQVHSVLNSQDVASSQVFLQNLLCFFHFQITNSTVFSVITGDGQHNWKSAQEESSKRKAERCPWKSIPEPMLNYMTRTCIALLRLLCASFLIG